MFWKSDKEKETKMDEIAKAREKAIASLKTARASLNGEDNWFLCVRKSGNSDMNDRRAE